MNEFIEKINNIISKSIYIFLILLFTMIIIGMAIVNSIYLYNDSPDFIKINKLNYISIIINIFIFIAILKINKFMKNKICDSKKINTIIIICFCMYFIFEIIFLKLIPIKPFSDMYYVADIALSNFTRNLEYLETHHNNLATIIVFNLIFKITTYDVISLKIFNILCNILTIYFTYKIYCNIFNKKNKMVLFLGMILIPIFLYVNNIYNDTIFTTIVTIVIYLTIKNDKTKKDIILISILSFIQFIIRPVGILLIIAICMYYILKNKNIKNPIILLSIFIILNIAYIPIENMYIPKNSEKKDYPIWSFIQIGLNEAKFGFQDGSYSSKWTFEDVKDRINELGPVRLTKLLSKKTFWLWTEGTYQAERYAFGAHETEYFYDTRLTEEVKKVEDSELRKAIDYMMKGQYFVIILLSLIDILIKDKKEINCKKDLLLYIIVGTFCFYIIWEMKSRYIYHLYPIFLILATSGIEKIIEKGEKRSGKIQKN